MAVESPDPGLVDSGKDSPIPAEDSGKNYSSSYEQSPTPLMGQEEKPAKTVTSTAVALLIV